MFKFFYLVLDTYKTYINNLDGYLYNLICIDIHQRHQLWDCWTGGLIISAVPRREDRTTFVRSHVLRHQEPPDVASTRRVRKVVPSGAYGEPGLPGMILI